MLMLQVGGNAAPGLGMIGGGGQKEALSRTAGHRVLELQ